LKHQLLVYADDLNTLDENINIVKRNTVAVLEAGRKVGLETNTEKTKYIVMSCQQNVGQNHYLLIVNTSFENMAKFKYEYLGTRVTNQNYVHEEIRNRLNSGSTCYSSVQSPLPSSLLSRDVKVKLYRIINLPVVFMDV
jgi:hypothetical protein